MHIVHEVNVLREEHALLLRANQDFIDDTNKKHSARDRWMIYGYCDYIPLVEAMALE